MKKQILLFTLLIASGCGPNVHKASPLSATGNNAIVGGEVADNAIFAKHVVAIYNRDFKYWCTGTLISNDTVLTAAHCLNNGTRFSYQLIFSKYPRASEQTTRPIADLKYHLDYQPATVNHRNDIGILRIKGSLPPGFAPMDLPTAKDVELKERNFYAAGYGVTTAKRGNPSDSGILRYTAQQIVGSPINSSQSQFYVNQRNGRGICFGDSGGPAFMKFDNRRVVVGIASAVYAPSSVGKGREDYDICRYDAIYTSVFHYLDWIAKASVEIHR